MRFDTPIYFRTVKSEYDAASGNYIDEPPVEEMRLASVTDTGDETLRLIYGTIKQGCKTIRLQNPYIKPYDYIRIGEKLYKPDKARKLRTKQSFVVSEVQ